MISLKTISRTITMLMLLSVFPLRIYADQFAKDGVRVEYDVIDDSTLFVKYAFNNSPEQITVFIDGKETTINHDGSAQINKYAGRSVIIRYRAGNYTDLWVSQRPHMINSSELKKMREDDRALQETIAKVSEKTLRRQRNQERVGFPSAIERLNKDPYFGLEAVSAFTTAMDSLIYRLHMANDKQAYIADNNISLLLDEEETALMLKKSEITSLAREVVNNSGIKDEASQITILNSTVELLNNRLAQREAAFSKLNNEVRLVEADKSESSNEYMLNYLVIGVIVLILICWAIITIKKRKRHSKIRSDNKYPQYPEAGNQDIVVRRKTMSILKKQSIDDVVDNPQYLRIDSSEFANDSAVRNIYIKNSCIKEVYNLYAEDLRESENPKEDGCMVLGRWVFDGETNSYDISLETVVFPGDDAIFKEYELNFGGKIKLRIADKLRKLRRETNLQYDLVCWIHSHPGLGVFFSNSDSNVQTQLKHTQHPNFLIAFVVDILTSTQEMGIFTFRKDGTMNSRGDLIKMYSLEEMYKWALGSEKASYNPDNYLDLLDKAKQHLDWCKSIELNNNAIIDLAQISEKAREGIAGWALGTSFEKDAQRNFVVSQIVKSAEKPSSGVIGVMVNVAHVSLPTIQRIIASEIGSLSFALVYSTKQNTLTSIPIQNGELWQDDNFYGEETLDDLKIWTRRKR